MRVANPNSVPIRAMATVASLALGWRGDLVTAVESSGYTVDVVVRFNSAELVRRDFGPPVLDRAALRAMLSLPAGITVPCTDIPTQDLLALELAESPVVELAGAGVRRLYEPACDIVGILATDRPLRRAVDAVGMFSPFAERSVFGTARQCRTQLRLRQSLRDRGCGGRGARCHRPPPTPASERAAQFSPVAFLRTDLREVAPRPQRGPPRLQVRRQPEGRRRPLDEVVESTLGFSAHALPRLRPQTGGLVQDQVERLAPDHRGVQIGLGGKARFGEPEQVVPLAEPAGTIPERGPLHG